VICDRVHFHLANRVQAAENTSKQMFRMGATMAKSFFSSDITIDGEIRSKGDIEIDGSVKGKVQAAAISVLGAGRLEGNVECTNLSIDGELQGAVSATDVTVASTGVVVADISYNTISTSKGAKIQGQLKVR
jgi:cytoskeletal protein CcmA (bactofilin family)